MSNFKQIGNCILINGDCMDIMQDIQDVDAIITDPPYGVDYQSNRPKVKEEGVDPRRPKIINDKNPFIWWLAYAASCCKDDAALASFSDWKVQDVWKTAIECTEFQIRSEVIWSRRGRPGMGNLKSAFSPMFDIIWFATKGKFAFQNGRPGSVLEYKRVSNAKMTHPTEKPVDLIRELVRVLTPHRGLVLDPFMGTGSCAVAAVAEGRSFIGIEMDQSYFDIACERVAKAVELDPWHAMDEHPVELGTTVDGFGVPTSDPLPEPVTGELRG
jgi:site-specific DNA-methyltransferase (adenine-specific)